MVLAACKDSYINPDASWSESRVNAHRLPARRSSLGALLNHSIPQRLAVADSRPPRSSASATLGHFTLVTGGTRSGKSRFAVQQAHAWGRRIVYLATWAAHDDAEMRTRIARHRRDRPGTWRTIEPPADPIEVLGQLPRRTDGVLLDCLTLYVSRLLVEQHSDAAIEQRIQLLCRAIRQVRHPVIVVTNEVGAGLVPDAPLGRRFRDLAGLANQCAAREADTVVWMVSGIPVWIKSAHQDNQGRSRSGLRVLGSGPLPPTLSPEPRAKSKFCS